VSSIDYTVKL